MRFVNYSINAPKELLLSILEDNNLVVDGLQYKEKRGKPRMHVRLRNGKIKINCEYTGRATKDTDFLGGTVFHGKIYESNGKTTLRGVVLTAPIYHLVLFLLFVFFIYRCITLGGISVVPICLVIFSLLVFKDEFSKQKVIKDYVFRAFKLTYKSQRGESGK